MDWAFLEKIQQYMDYAITINESLSVNNHFVSLFPCYQMLTHKHRWFPKWCDTGFCHPEHYFIPMPSFSSTKYRDNSWGHWSWLYSWQLPKRPIGNAYERPLGEGSDTSKEHWALTCFLIATIYYYFQTNLLPVNGMFFRFMNIPSSSSKPIHFL